MSLHRRHLDKAGRLLFRNTVVLCNVTEKCKPLPHPKHPHLRPAVAAFNILSALMLSTYGAKGSVMTAK